MECLYRLLDSVYTGFRDTIILDREPSFKSEEFRENAKNMGVHLQFSCIEDHRSIGKGERYHYTLRRMFEVTKSEYIKLADMIILRMYITQ